MTFLPPPTGPGSHSMGVAAQSALPTLPQPVSLSGLLLSAPLLKPRHSALPQLPADKPRSLALVFCPLPPYYHILFFFTKGAMCAAKLFSISQLPLCSQGGSHESFHLMSRYAPEWASLLENKANLPAETLCLLPFSRLESLRFLISASCSVGRTDPIFILHMRKLRGREVIPLSQGYRAQSSCMKTEVATTSLH